MNKNCPKCQEQWPYTARVCFTCGHRFGDVPVQHVPGLQQPVSDIPRPPVFQKRQSPLHEQIHRSLLVAIFIGVMLTAIYIIYQWSDSYDISGLPYIPLGYTAITGLVLLKLIDYSFHAVDFVHRYKQFEGLPEFLYRRGIMRSVRGFITYLIFAVFVAVVFPAFSFSIGIVDIPRGLPLSLSAAFFILSAYHMGFMAYLILLKRREGLSSMASRITRTFDPNTDYGVFSKIKNTISPETGIALDRKTEVSWQIERYTYLGITAIAFTFMLERAYNYQVGPFSETVSYTHLTLPTKRIV